MKKLFLILFALLLAASMLSGCSSDDTAADADDTTTSGEETAESGAAEVSGDIMIYTSAEDAFISEVCAMFNKKYSRGECTILSLWHRRSDVISGKSEQPAGGPDHGL